MLPPEDPRFGPRHPSHGVLSLLHIQSIPHDHYRLVCRRLIAPTRWRAYLTKEGRCCDTCTAPDLFRSMNLLQCSECAPRCRSIPATLQDYLPITVHLYFPDQLLGCSQPPRFEMFPHHAGNGPSMVHSSAGCKTLTNFDRDSTILLHRSH